MRHRLTALGLMTAILAGLMTAGASGQTAADKAKAKKALQEVQEFIGPWNLEGTQKVGTKTEAWKEKTNWSWKFDKDNAWITVDFEKGKFFTHGDLKYLTDKKKYQLTMTAADKAEQVFEGDYAKGVLKLDRKDPKGDVYRLTMQTLADGVRFQLKYEKQEGGRGLFAAVYQSAGNKEGESLAKTTKKPECIVTGGAATIQVSYMGQTYYVCCTGCRDEFNANPAKFVNAKK